MYIMYYIKLNINYYRSYYLYTFYDKFRAYICKRANLHPKLENMSKLY